MKVLILCLLLVGALARPQRRHPDPMGRSKIVGGTAATRGQFPYQLSFQIRGVLATSYCGASIYNSKTALTAGHCVYGEDYANPQNLVVIAGELNLAINSGDEQELSVNLITLNAQYNPSTTSHDVALLRVATSFDFNTVVNSIPIAATGSVPTGNCIVSGWGTLEAGGSISNVLQYVTVPIVSNADCNDAYGSIDSTMICAGEAGKDSCQGDSGGPLVKNGVQVGIVSWGRGCAEAKYPGVYTDVAFFNTWITNNAF